MQYNNVALVVSVLCATLGLTVVGCDTSPASPPPASYFNGVWIHEPEGSEYPGHLSYINLSEGRVLVDYEGTTDVLKGKIIESNRIEQGYRILVEYELGSSRRQVWEEMVRIGPERMRSTDSYGGSGECTRVMDISRIPESLKSEIERVQSDSE